MIDLAIYLAVFAVGSAAALGVLFAIRAITDWCTPSPGSGDYKW